MNLAGVMFKIVLIAIFFPVDISYVISELQKREELRRFAKLVEIPEEGYLPILEHNRGFHQSSPDLNWFRKKITRADLEEREFKWGYSSSRGYYIGYKLTLAIEYPSLKPVAFLLHQGSPGDAKIYEEILEELKRRRIVRNGDTIILDKGYYGYRNYVLGISRFKVIPAMSACTSGRDGSFVGY
ncbi:MAG: transposase [Candidatus Syntropharchaeia archaeon]